MSVRLILGGSGSGKSAFLYRELIQRSIQEPDGKFFLIVPDQFSMQTQKDLVQMHEKKGILNIDVLSFGRLTHRIFEELGGVNRPMLDDTGKSLIVRRVAALKKEQMPVIGGNLGKTGYVHEVKSAISEFMQYGIRGSDLEELTEFSQKRGQLSAKLKDLKVIYEGFLEFIHDRFLTAEESLEVLADLLPSSELMRGSVVAFDGFTGFTPVQNRVLRCLFSMASEVLITVTLDGREDVSVQLGEQELFSLSKKTVRSLEKLKDRIDPKTVLYSNHHANPVPQEYIDKYIACAKKIIETPEQGKTMKYGRALWNVMEYEDVRLTFDRQGKEEEDAG